MGEKLDNDSKFDVILTKSGRDKVEMMKAVIIVTGWNTAQAKHLIDRLPGVVLRRVSQEKANQAKASLEHAGAQVEIRPSR